MAGAICTKAIADFYQLRQSRLARIWERDGRRCHWCGIEPLLVELELARKAYKHLKHHADYLESLTPYEVIKMWLIRWAMTRLKRMR